MSTGYSWEDIRQVRATLLGVRHVPECLCGGYVYLGCYIKCSTFTLPLQMSKITNDGLTGFGTGLFTAVSAWQQWASKG